MPNPGFPLNCPKCGQKLAYVRSEGENHFYRCPSHGAVILPPSGVVRVDDPDDQP